MDGSLQVEGVLSVKELMQGIRSVASRTPLVQLNSVGPNELWTWLPKPD